MTALDILKAGTAISTIAFVTLFLIAIPAYIFRKAKRNKNYDADDAWGKGVVGIFAFLHLL